MDQKGAVSIATRYELDGLGIESRWEARFSAPVQTGPGANPAYLVPFPAVRRPRPGNNQPNPSSAEVKERIELYIYSRSLWASMASSRAKFTLRSRVFCDAVNAVGFKNFILFKGTRVNLISIRYIENESLP